MNEDCKKALRKIYKTIIKRIVDTGLTLDSDVLFLHFFKTEIEQNTNLKEIEEE